MPSLAKELAELISTTGQITVQNEDIVSVANTKIDGLITSNQIANVAANKIIGTLGGNYAMQVFTTPGTFDADTKKSNGLKAVKVTVQAAGGNVGPSGETTGGAGGGGGASIEYISAPNIPGPVSVTVGTAPSKTSSFGGFLSATGGGNGTGAPGPNPTLPGNGGAGGAGSGGDINLAGWPGTPGGVGVAYRSGEGALGWLSYGPGSTTGIQGIVIVEEFY